MISCSSDGWIVRRAMITVMFFVLLDPIQAISGRDEIQLSTATTTLQYNLELLLVSYKTLSSLSPFFKRYGILNIEVLLLAHLIYSEMHKIIVKKVPSTY